MFDSLLAIGILVLLGLLFATAVKSVSAKDRDYK